MTRTMFAVTHHAHNDRLAADTIVRIKEVELTLRSLNVKYLPTFHKFNELMDNVVYYFGNQIKN